jgi:hypothetical protein
MIIPCTELSGVEAEFSFTVFSDVPLELRKGSL